MRRPIWHEALCQPREQIRGACNVQMPHRCTLAVALGGADGTELTDVLPDVVRVFASCDTQGVAVANGLARLQELSAVCPEGFIDAVVHCVPLVLAAESQKAVRPVEAATELLAMLADHVEVEGLALALSQSVCAAFGQHSPRDRNVRVRAAQLLWRLLAARPDLASSVEAVILPLSCDKTPQVRLAIVPGLALLANSKGRSRLVTLATDVSTKIRIAALAQLQHTPELPLAQLLERTMDVSSTVRCQLYRALGTSPPVDTGILVTLVCRGFRDTDSSVRASFQLKLEAWLDSFRVGDDASALVSFLSVFKLGSSHACEDAAHLTVEYLVAQPEWGLIAARFSRQMLFDDDPMSAEHMFLASVWLAHEARSHFYRIPSPSPTHGIVKRTLHALECGSVFELRQLLLALLQVDVPEGGGRVLMGVATAVILRAPLEAEAQLGALPDNVRLLPEVSRSGTSLCHLAVILVRRTLGIQSGHPRRRLEEQFSQAVLVVLRVLRGVPAQDSATDSTLESLGRRLDELLEELHQLRRTCTEPHNNKHEMARSTACRLQDQISQTRMEQLAELEARVTSLAVDLGSRLLRTLCVMEAALSHMVAPQTSSFGTQEDLLRFALLRADVAPPGLGGVCWPLLRAMAVRCLALLGSMTLEAADRQWPFFCAVLQRCVPTVVSPPGDLEIWAETVAEHCVLFLTDTLVSDQETSGARAHEFFNIVAPLLSARSRSEERRGPSPKLRRCLINRLCVCHLFGAWQVSETPGSIWAMTWLAFEAFTQQGSPSTDHGDAVMRSRLLSFFGLLATFSTRHVSSLASAIEGFFSLGMWQVCSISVQGETDDAERSRAASLPVFVSFMSQQLLNSVANTDSLVIYWLESLWRPLALACLENAVHEPHSHAEFPQALTAALMSTSPTKSVQHALHMTFAPESMRAPLVAEVAWVLNRAVELWGWNRSEALLPTQILELREQAVAWADPSPANWTKIYHDADKKRSQLRQAVSILGGDVDSILAQVATPIQETAGVHLKPAQTARKTTALREPLSNKCPKVERITQSSHPKVAARVVRSGRFTQIGANRGPRPQPVCQGSLIDVQRMQLQGLRGQEKRRTKGHQVRRNRYADPGESQHTDLLARKDASKRVQISSSCPDGKRVSRLPRFDALQDPVEDVGDHVSEERAGQSSLVGVQCAHHSFLATPGIIQRIDVSARNEASKRVQTTVCNCSDGNRVFHGDLPPFGVSYDPVEDAGACVGVKETREVDAVVSVGQVHGTGSGTTSHARSGVYAQLHAVSPSCARDFIEDVRTPDRSSGDLSSLWEPGMGSARFSPIMDWSENW